MTDSEKRQADKRKTIAQNWSLVRATRLNLDKIRYHLKHGIIHLIFDIPEYFKFIFGGLTPGKILLRIKILRRFRAIHRAIECPHIEGELLRMAGEILTVPDSLPGDIIECGAYKGGSACKLSIIAKLTGRKLLVCDSFEGLPEPNEGENDLFGQKEWSGLYEEVRDNIVRMGQYDSVELIPGWFDKTLPELRDRKFVAIFEDADLYDSIVCCLENLWPALQPGCKLFTHETPYPLAARAFRDKTLWQRLFGELPPPLIRVGKGLGVFRPNLGHIKKSLR